MYVTGATQKMPNPPIAAPTAIVRPDRHPHI